MGIRTKSSCNDLLEFSNVENKGFVCPDLNYYSDPLNLFLDLSLVSILRTCTPSQDRASLLGKRYPYLWDQLRHLQYNQSTTYGEPTKIFMLINQLFPYYTPRRIVLKYNSQLKVGYKEKIRKVGFKFNLWTIDVPNWRWKKWNFIPCTPQKVQKIFGFFFFHVQ